jgi:hypothetical protein
VLSPVRGKDGPALGAVEGSERAAGVDLGQLARIADQHHLGVRPISMVEQHVQLAGAHHHRLSTTTTSP